MRALTEAQLQTVPLEVCVSLGTCDSGLKSSLASRKGTLVKLVDLSAGLDLAPLLHEISRSTNTAAAGGNAALMTLQQ